MRRVISLWFPRFTTDQIGQRRPDWRSEPLVTVRKNIVKKKKLSHTNRSLNISSVHAELSVRVAETNKFAEEFLQVETHAPQPIQAAASNAC